MVAESPFLSMLRRWRPYKGVLLVYKSRGRPEEG